MDKEKKVIKVKEVTKKKKKISVDSGRAYVQATFNNTIITLTDGEGNTLVQSSPSAVGFSGSKRSTAFAATKAAKEAAMSAIKKYGLKEVKVYISGVGTGRNAAVKGLDSAGLRITYLADRTPIAHNGCRAKRMPS